MVDRSSPADGGAARTSVRLALALLGYIVLVTLVITLSPFDFAPRPFRVSLWMAPSDMIANVALFLPLGFLMRSLESDRTRYGWRVVALAATFSVLIEIAQIFIRGRFVSPVDVATNTAGACLGVLLRDRLERWAMWRADLVGRIGLDIPLVGLLYLLVPQLWLSSVGLVGDLRRSATTVVLGCAGSVVLVALHRHRWPGGIRLAAKVVPLLALLWFMIGALPGLAASGPTFAAMALAIVVVTAWLARPGAEPHEPRFEVDTLRRFLPVFMLYLVASALWPLVRAFAPWHGALLFLSRRSVAGYGLIALLEQVGAFTLFGYAIAEWRGRRELSLAADVPRVTLSAAAFATLLEILHGVLAGPGASLLRAMLCTSGAVYGAAMYHLARAHVRALRASQPQPASREEEDAAA